MARPPSPGRSATGGVDLWGGIECTVARLGDQYRDQLVETGHWRRRGDARLLQSLGIRTLRYPILWETHAANARRPGFGRTEERLLELREAGIEVIAGLVHHGSGPVHTDLLDPEFPRKLADYAGEVAARFPWIRRWTPVNEPLTTARFSCLYGHWYPHRRDYPAFLTALVNQCAGSAAAMAAIRATNPVAELVQTEDLGRTFSTPPLCYQAEHDNARRWLSLDLLCGSVGPGHPMRPFLTDAGIPPSVLDSFRTAPTPPDIIGINHYLTSDRFLDDRLHFYPEEQPGGNGRDSYVDVEAVRLRHLAGKVGLAARLHEAWRRYRRPLAVTEVHHGCTREAQLRWLAECWRTGLKLRAEGVDLRAVTLWSLFGHYDWRSLLTRREGIYDAGAFDIRGPQPRLTAVGRAAQAIARGGEADHPVADQPGWWRRSERFYAWQGNSQAEPPTGPPILIAGASGTLGQALARICARRGIAFRLTARPELDICDERAIEKALARYRPWAVINAAGFVRVADAARERESCFAWNARGPALLAAACAERGLPLVTFSSDLVFDGEAGEPYDERDPVNPCCIYGESKAEGERLVLGAHPEALVIRTAAFFGEWDRYNFAHNVLAALERGERPSAADAERISPTYVPDLCNAALDLLIDSETGFWHLANQGSVSWLEFARLVAEGSGYDPALIRNAPARPRTTTLRTIRGAVMRSLPEALSAYLVAREAEQAVTLAVAAE